jgi:hypothetical protein
MQTSCAGVGQVSVAVELKAKRYLAMQAYISLDHTKGLVAAHVICTASEQQVIEMFHQLRIRRELMQTVQVLNNMLLDPSFSTPARTALSRFGLEYGG